MVEGDTKAIRFKGKDSADVWLSVRATEPNSLILIPAAEKQSHSDRSLLQIKTQ